MLPVVSYQQQEILENILNAGGLLIHNRSGDTFNVEGFEWYDMTHVFSHLSKTREDVNEVYYRVKDDVIAVIEDRKKYIK